MQASSAEILLILLHASRTGMYNGLAPCAIRISVKHESTMRWPAKSSSWTATTRSTLDISGTTRHLHIRVLPDNAPYYLALLLIRLPWGNVTWVTTAVPRDTSHNLLYVFQ